MSLKYTILGMLSHKPCTGYDLQKKIETTISHFWPSTQSQIYRTLKELSENEIITSKLEYQSDKPNKKEYFITKKGEEELFKWLSQPLKLSNHRNQFLVQLFFSNDIDKDRIIKNLESYREEMERRLHFLESEQTVAMVKTAKTKKEKAIYEIIQSNGLSALQSEIRWVDESIKKLSDL